MRRPLTIATTLSLAAGTAAGWLLSADRRPVPATGAPSPSVPDPSDLAANADLIAVKAEAESLAVAGRLAEAHAVYRTLAERTVGRELRGPLAWDLAERAKAEQDRVYWILVSNLRGADLAFFKAADVGTSTPGVLASGRRPSPAPIASSPPAPSPAEPAAGRSDVP